MAALPDPPLVSVDEYLNSSYHPDMEYVDGVLGERSMPSIAHGVLQLLLGAWFHAYRRQFRFVMMSETRTQIVERARYRISDVILSPTPLPQGKVLTQAPWSSSRSFPPRTGCPSN